MYCCDSSSIVAVCRTLRLPLRTLAMMSRDIDYYCIGRAEYAVPCKRSERSYTPVFSLAVPSRNPGFELARYYLWLQRQLSIIVASCSRPSGCCRCRQACNKLWSVQYMAQLGSDVSRENPRLACRACIAGASVTASSSAARRGSRNICDSLVSWQWTTVAAYFLATILPSVDTPRALLHIEGCKGCHADGVLKT